jgi:hypothetical protein
MPSETIVSPGILAVENDQPFVLQLPVQADAAIIGPTVKGKVGIPTIVTSYSDYKNKYGETFVSGGTTYTYFTSLAAYNYFQNLSPNPGALLVTRVVSGSTATDWTPATSSFISSSAHTAGVPYNTDVFVLETLSEGIIMNSVGPTGSNGTLLSGSADNFRFQIVSPNTQSGTFSLIIRQGNDSSTLMSIIDTIGPVSLDPNSSNYIEKVIGNQIELISQDPTTGEYYTQLSGSYPNKYSTIRVKQVNQPTPNYFDNNGLPKPQYTGSIPIVQSGVFGDGKGSNIPTIYDGLYNENITDINIQGLSPFAYTESISLLANKDAYNYNLIVTPGLIADPNFFPDSNSVITQLLNVVENRGNCMAVIDLAKYNENLGQVTSNAQNQDNSYAAAYWPWVKAVHPSNSSTQVWSPASTFIPGVYAFNDKNGYPWLAPAGVNRGVMTIATQTEKILTQGNRDILYQNKVNPIASIPTAQGGAIVVYGQKTLQTQNTSLTRVNVRRLLINLKNYISRIANSFVFEQNTPATREQFLSLVNPYLSIVQQQEGLTAFQVIMDETNNPPNVVDNNQLIGQIYLQPTKTAEFILLDFNILPTGATFPTQ